MSVRSAAGAVSFEEAHRMLSSDPALDDAVARVNQLDLGMVMERLFLDGWTIEKIADVENLYRKFLALNARYPGRKICPTGPIDDFWHAHILDTRAYMRDCDAVFGGYLHHFPYFGMRGPEDRAALEAAFRDSLELFIVHFGIDPTAGDTLARSCSSQRCP